VAAALLGSGCTLKFASAGARCSKVGDFAQDRTFVLKCNKQRRWERALTVAAGDAFVCAVFKINCPPPPPPPPPTQPPNRAPTITAFGSSRTGGPVPFTAALFWEISDPEGSPMTCRVNLGDGSSVRTIPNCDDLDDVATTYRNAGLVSASLSVSDGALSSSATVTLTPTGPTADPFDITIRMGTQTPAPTPAQQTALTNAVNAAASRWESVIPEGLGDVIVPSSGPGAIAAGDCEELQLESFSGTIDDVVIDVRIAPIDGPSQVLAYAGSCRYRSSSGLSGFGVMVVDSADIDALSSDGRLAGAVLHEMGHVLGIGGSGDSNWIRLLVDVAAPGVDVRFAGPIASAMWQTLGGTSAVPVETDGGSGTAYGHWDEETFNTELMTGYSEPAGIATPLSVITVGALGDLGYGVDLFAADPYSLSPLASKDSSSARSAGTESPFCELSKRVPNSPFR